LARRETACRKILIPGVVSHSTDLVEHSEPVADRIITFAELAGRENVIANRLWPS
jgi:5-methyltetrahydropteroyltriglutamate--homocysteine methyltransferase